VPELVPGDAEPGWAEVPDAEPLLPPVVCARAGIARTVAKLMPKIKVLRMSLSSV
jgi:hypothetical protein